MSAETAHTEAKRREVLRAEIARHDELYFKQAAPEISDAAYDRLKRELAELERKAEMERSVEIAQENAVSADAAEGGSASGARVGDDRSGRFPTWWHGERMMSLEKVYAETELRAFLKRVEAAFGEQEAASGERPAEGESVGWVIEPKYDGLAISATYERGRLVRVVTRGNGIEGDDVTANARRIAALPELLRGTMWPERIEVRGEVFVEFAAFARANAARAAAGETMFANPRALAAGSLKLSDAEAVRARGLSVVFYGWGEVQPESARPVTQSGFHERVKAWGLPGVAGSARATTVEDVCAAVRAFERMRAGLVFPTDGVVIKLDDAAQQERLGATEHAPRWAVAYKFSAEQAATRVTGITIQVGRSGVLTPVAELAPVRLGGSVIARATLHNAEEIARLDVRVGDEVWVEKAGEIIPVVVGVNFAGRAEMGEAVTERVVTEKAWAGRFIFPEDCPVCGAAVVTRTEEAVRQYCPNRECVAQVAARLRHFAGAQGVGIRGLGEATIDALVVKRGVCTPADIYRLTRDNWRALPGVGAKSAEKLVAAVETSRRAELWRFIHGLGVPGIGVTTSRILAARVASLEELAALSRTELAAINGVGAVQAEALEIFFAEAENLRLIAELRACGVEPRRMRADETKRIGRLAGKVFVLTGTLPTLTRMQAEERIVAAGGTVGTGVTAKTDFLVIGTDAGAGEKQRRAEALGVRIIDEEALRRLLVEGVTDQ